MYRCQLVIKIVLYVHQINWKVILVKFHKLINPKILEDIIKIILVTQTKNENYNKMKLA